MNEHLIGEVIEADSDSESEHDDDAASDKGYHSSDSADTDVSEEDNMAPLIIDERP